MSIFLGEDQAAEHAAGLFSGHRFADIPPILEHWAAAAARAPRGFRPLTRVKVWNTLGRALAIIGRSGWDELFDLSLGLHRRLNDSEGIDRTTHYRVHARLRHGDIIGARSALTEARSLDERAGAGNAWAAFLHANLARMEYREWADPLLEEQLAAGARPYSAWLYVQATARQSRRGPEDALSRMELAIQLLQHDAGEGNVCDLFASFLALDIAARRGDPKRWAKAVADARCFLSSAPDHRLYYGPAVESLPVVPCRPAAEALNDQIPYV